MKLRNINVPKLLVALVICQLAGVVGTLFTTPSISTWYATLRKPFFNPPNWLFGPVWVTLFILMGISFYLVWNKGAKNKKVKIALGAFAIQLALNALWSILFFGLRSPFYAFIEIVMLWTAIVFTIIKFYKISRGAALLLLPYIIWVTIAAVLNLSVWMLNPL